MMYFYDMQPNHETSHMYFLLLMTAPTVKSFALPVCLYSVDTYGTSEKVIWGLMSTGELNWGLEVTRLCVLVFSGEIL